MDYILIGCCLTGFSLIGYLRIWGWLRHFIGWDNWIAWLTCNKWKQLKVAAKLKPPSELSYNIQFYETTYIHYEKYKV